MFRIYSMVSSCVCGQALRRRVRHLPQSFEQDLYCFRSQLESVSEVLYIFSHYQYYLAEPNIMGAEVDDSVYRWSVTNIVVTVVL